MYTSVSHNLQNTLPNGKTIRLEALQTALLGPSQAYFPTYFLQKPPSSLQGKSLEMSHSAVHWGVVLLQLEYPSRTLVFFLSSVFPNTSCALFAINVPQTSRACQPLKK